MTQRASAAAGAHRKNTKQILNAADIRPMRTKIINPNSSAMRYKVKRYLNECVIDSLYYRSNSCLTEKQWQEGIKFRRYWLASMQQFKVTAHYEIRVGKGNNTSHLRGIELFLNARKYIDQTLKQLTPAQQRVVVKVCGYDEPVGLARKTLIRALQTLVSAKSQSRNNDICQENA